MKVILNIEGMHCEKCAARLQKALINKEGVLSAEVSKSTDTAVIDFNDLQVSVENLKSVVEDCGFSVTNN